jgi:raffinose/stachyose/melibiose transport system permease protein
MRAADISIARGSVGALRRRRNVNRLAATSFAAVCALVPLAPLIWVVVTSVRTRGEVIRDPLGLPANPNWQAFADSWDAGRFGQLFANSTIVAIGSVIGILVLSTLAAYAFAVLPMRARNVWFAIFVAGLIVPIGLLVVPLFYQMLGLGLLNTLWALILPQIAISLPFGIVLLRAFIRDVPPEIIDAARVDGCGSLRLLTSIVVPLIKPALFALIVFNVVWSWNQFLLPLILTQDPKMHTLPLGLSFFIGRYAADLPRLMAGATISLIPTVIVYVALQRHLIRGITAGAFK